MKVSIIAAVAENGVIGKDNDLAWHLPDDMEFFKATTQGRTVIMGRRNYESIPHKYRPLPKRTNIVVTRNGKYDAPGCIVVTGIDQALEAARSGGESQAFIIGGGEIYKLSLEENIVDDLYITHVHHQVEGDTHFPEIDQNIWKGVLINEHPIDLRHQFAFTIMHYTRISSV